MNDGEADFSKYTHEQIARSLQKVDREKYPLNYAKLQAALLALPLPLDAAALEESRNVALRQVMANGEIWLSSPWTVIFNTLFAGAFAAWGCWLAWRFAADPANVWNVDRLKDLPVTGRQMIGLLIIGCCGLLAWTLPGLRRVVVREGRLEVRSLFARTTIELHDIERVRWNDAPERYENTQALIELRADSGLGRRVRFMPSSDRVMRAIAAHVAAVKGRTDVADPAYVSVFSVGPADP